MNIHIFPGKYHQNGGFFIAMLVYRSVDLAKGETWKFTFEKQKHQSRQLIIPQFKVDTVYCY